MTRGTALKIGSLGWAVLLAACAGEPEPTDSPPATTRLAEAASPDSEALLTQFWSELYALLGPEGASAIANVPTPKAPKGAYGWGHGCKKKVRYEIDLLAKAVELIKSYKVPAGVGAHALDVVKACEKEGIRNDFYIKTFHHHDYPTGPKPDQIKGAYSEFPGYWCSHPRETAEFMGSISKPWIAFKVMAAGAIPPKSAFPYVFSRGADFILAGMFDFEIAEDAELIKGSLAGVKDRSRPWCA